MTESKTDLLESLEQAIEEFHQIRQELGGNLNPGRPAQEESASTDTLHLGQ